MNDDAKALCIRCGHEWPWGTNGAHDCADAFEAREKKLRVLLAFAVGSPGLYTDDGELHDTSETPFIDFKRDSPEKIEAALRERALKRPEVRAALGMSS